jgi:hypothetical protein
VLASPKSASEKTGDYQNLSNANTLDVQTIKSVLFGASNSHIHTSQQGLLLKKHLCCSVTDFAVLM